MHTSGYGIRKTIAKHKGKAPEVRAASGGEVLKACKLSYMRGRMTASEVASMAHAADQPLQIKGDKKPGFRREQIALGKVLLPLTLRDQALPCVCRQLPAMGFQD